MAPQKKADRTPKDRGSLAGRKTIRTELEARLREAVSDPTAAFNAGNEVAEVGDLETAVELLTLAAEGGEDDAWLNLGLILRDLDRPHESIFALTEATRVGPQPGGTSPAVVLAEQLLKIWQIEQAWRALPPKGSGEAYQLVKARVIKARSGTDSALHFLRDVNKLSPALRLEKAYLHFEAGDIRKSRRLFALLHHEFPDVATRMVVLCDAILEHTATKKTTRR